MIGSSMIGFDEVQDKALGEYNAASTQVRFNRSSLKSSAIFERLL